MWKYTEIGLKVARITIVPIGMGVIILYCLLENIMPDDLSIGDAFGLIYVTVAFGAVIVVGLLYGAFSVLWLVYLFIGWRNWKYSDKPKIKLLASLGNWMMCVSSFLSFIAFFIVFVLLPSAPEMNGIGTMVFFYLVGLFLLLLFGLEKGVTSNGSEAGRKKVGSLILVLFFAFLIILKPSLLNVAMELVGIRSFPNSLILVREDKHVVLSELVKAYGLEEISFCQLQGTKLWGTIDARVVWQGVGKTSFVQLMGVPNKNSNKLSTARNILVPIPRDDLIVIRPSGVGISGVNPLCSQNSEPPLLP